PSGPDGVVATFSSSTSAHVRCLWRIKSAPSISFTGSVFRLVLCRGCFDIHQTRCDACGIVMVPSSECGDRFRLITPVMVDRCVWTFLHHGEKLIPHPFFIYECISPQGMVSTALSLTYEQSH